MPDIKKPYAKARSSRNETMKKGISIWIIIIKPPTNLAYRGYKNDIVSIYCFMMDLKEFAGYLQRGERLYGGRKQDSAPVGFFFL